MGIASEADNAAAQLDSGTPGGDTHGSEGRDALDSVARSMRRTAPGRSPASAIAALDPGAVQRGDAESPYGWIPEKFHVTGEGGKFDLEASARKGMESLAALEKRMKHTGLPPEKPDDYVFTPPEGVRFDPKEMGLLQKSAHSLGLTQKQYEGVIGIATESIPELLNAGRQLEVKNVLPLLHEDWGGGPGHPNFEKNMGFAVQAFNAFADPRDAGAMDRVGSDPAVLRLLAKIGAEMQEDRSVTEGGTTRESLESLMQDPAYFDATHPKHAEVVAKAKQHFAAVARANQARGG